MHDQCAPRPLFMPLSPPVLLWLPARYLRKTETDLGCRTPLHDLLHCETHTYDNSLSDFLFCCTHSIAEAIYQYWYFSIVPHGVSLSFFEETAPALVHGTPLC